MLAIVRAGSDRLGLSGTLTFMCLLALTEGAQDEGRAQLDAALALARDLRHQSAFAEALTLREPGRVRTRGLRVGARASDSAVSSLSRSTAMVRRPATPPAPTRAASPSWGRPLSRQGPGAIGVAPPALA